MNFLSFKAALSDLSFPVKTVTLTAILVLLATIGVVELSNFTGQITGIWVANAIMLAAILKHHHQAWPAILGGGMVANIVAGIATVDAPHAVILGVLNIAEILVVAVPMRLFGLDRDFTRPHSLLVFYALAAGPAPLVTAIFAAGFEHFASGAPFVWEAINWYGSDALGLVIVVPPLLTVRWKAVKAMFAPDQIAITLLLLGIVAATIVIAFFAHRYPLAFLFFPAVLLLTFQRGFAGGAMGLLMTGAYLVVRAVLGSSGGVLSHNSTFEQVTIVQIFIAVVGLSVVLVGAALEERRKLERGLAAAIARAETSREEAVVAKDTAEKASRSKSMFLATMSHELRTPLNAVIGFAELMNSEAFGPLGDSRYREYSGVIQNAGRHLLDLINDILDMSKIEAGKHELDKEYLSADEIVQDCIDLMNERALQGEVKLKAELHPKPFKVFADRRAMKQILLNVVSNAVKFTPAGGSVIVRARAVDGRFVLTVSDTGVGIPADQIYRLGNPFVQLRNNAGATGKGTGLGLALVRALSEMHGGTFKIESVKGHGTTVTVSIPLRDETALAA
jgi:signal transduction histidine kinase